MLSVRENVSGLPSFDTPAGAAPPRLRATPSVNRAVAGPIARPFLKWAGGKSRLLSSLTELLPANVKGLRYVEPFVGGGALFFALSPAESVLSDINAELIGAYAAVRDDVDGLASALKQLERVHSAESYALVRASFNRKEHATATQLAAWFIYLVRTAFNGLYRVNRKGHFNVPMGRYAKPRVVELSNLCAASASLRRATLLSGDFQLLADGLGKGDFVYLDPPYVPTSATANFRAYSASGFEQRDHERLHTFLVDLDRRGAKVMLSNSDTPYTRQLYRAWHMHRVSVTRSVAARSAARAAITELVVTNYPTP